MQQFIDKLISRLEDIVNEVAEEYKGGWIPCSEALPDTSQWESGTIGRYYLVSYYPDTVSKAWVGIKAFMRATNQFGCEEEVIAWMPLPSPYQKEGK